MATFVQLKALRSGLQQPGMATFVPQKAIRPGFPWPGKVMENGLVMDFVKT